MKKIFSLMAFAASATFALAQTAVQPTMVNIRRDMSKLQKSLPADASARVIGKSVNGPKKTAATGNYYTKPAGSMYIDYGKDGYGFSSTLLNTTAFVDAVFTNMNPNPASTTWQWGSYSAADMGLVDENNNFVWTGIPTPYNADLGSISTYPIPTLISGSDSYYVGMENGNAALVSTTFQGGAECLTFTHDNVGFRFAYFSNSTDYVWGTGTTDLGDGDTYTNYGVRQSFEKPMTPLYVEDIFSTALSKNNDSQPLKNGAELTMTIYDDKENVIATLKATADDLIPLGSTSQITAWGQTYIWNVVFSQKEHDPIMGDVSVPFTIDTPFTVEITGLDNSNVNMGFYGFEPAAEDPIEAGALLARSQTTGQGKQVTYNRGYVVPMTFTGFFDNIDVVSLLSDGTYDYDNCNVLRISDDGSACALDNGLTDGVYVNTATPWSSDAGDNYYYEVATSSDGVGDWITTCNAVTDYWEDEYGLNILGFTATPCPAGEGRWAVVNIVGRGVTSATPIILLQGTATLDDVEMSTGITNVTTGNSDKKFDPNAPIYNLNGQRVSKSATGILIQNGRKFIKK